MAVWYVTAPLVGSVTFAMEADEEPEPEAAIGYWYDSVVSADGLLEENHKILEHTGDVVERVIQGNYWLVDAPSEIEIEGEDT